MLVGGENVNDVRGRIALVEFIDEIVRPTSDHEAVIKRLSDAGARAVIGCFATPSGDLYGHHAIPPFIQSAWPIPVATVGARHWHILRHAAQAGDPAALLRDGRDLANARARSVIARRQRSDKWIIVSTPQSGWFRSAGERGT
ncbi:MAG: hypothetical protein ACI9DC_002781 [Gammaproteobacteria bacterium]|jgi:hypothetical protein